MRPAGSEQTPARLENGRALHDSIGLVGMGRLGGAELPEVRLDGATRRPELAHDMRHRDGLIRDKALPRGAQRLDRFIGEFTATGPDRDLWQIGQRRVKTGNATSQGFLWVGLYARLRKMNNPLVRRSRRVCLQDRLQRIALAASKCGPRAAVMITRPTGQPTERIRRTMHDDDSLGRRKMQSDHATAHTRRLQGLRPDRSVDLGDAHTTRPVGGLGWSFGGDAHLLHHHLK